MSGPRRGYGASGDATGSVVSGSWRIAGLRYEARYGDRWMFEVAERYVAFCKERGLHPVGAAIAWVGAHPAITAPIVGARNLDQLKDSLASVDIAMTPELRAEIAALSRTPPPATDRLEEQKVVAR